MYSKKERSGGETRNNGDLDSQSDTGGWKWEMKIMMLLMIIAFVYDANLL